MSELQREHNRRQARRCAYRVLRLIVCPASRRELHRRIEERFRAMLESGFIDEVKSLRGRGDLRPDLPSMRCVAYRQAWRYLEGEFNLDEMSRQAIAATRQLAKRQLTWLRQESGAVWYDLSQDAAQESVFAKVAAFLEL